MNYPTALIAQVIASGKRAPWPYLESFDAWWNTSAGYTLSGATVSSWADRISGHLLTQPTTGLQPTWGATGFTYATSRLQGASIVADLLGQAKPFTLMCKVKPSAAGLTGVAWSATSVALASPWRAHRSASGTDQGVGGTGGTSGSRTWGASDLVLTYQYTGARMKTRVNGLGSVDVALGGIGIDCDELTIGSQRFGGGGFLNSFSGKIGDILVKAGSTSDAIITAGEAWLAAGPAL